MTAANLALAVITAYCGWDPTADIDSDTLLDGNGEGSLWLPSLAVSDVSAVGVTTEDGVVHNLIVGVTGDVSWSRKGELRLTGNAVLNFGYNTWPCGIGNVSVTWRSESADDGALSAVLESLSCRLPSVGLQKAQIGTAVLQYGSGWAAGQLLEVEAMVLDRFRIVRTA